MAEREVEISDFINLKNIGAALHVYIVTFKFGPGHLGVTSIGLSRELSGLGDAVALEYFVLKQEFVLGKEVLKPTCLLCYQEIPRVEVEEFKSKVGINGQYYTTYSRKKSPYDEEFAERVRKLYEKGF